MKVYRVQRMDGAWVKGDERGRPLKAIGEPKRPIWTRDPERAAWWTKGGQNGGPDQWLAWYSALGQPDGEAHIEEYEDPTKSIGGEDD